MPWLDMPSAIARARALAPAQVVERARPAASPGHPPDPRVQRCLRGDPADRLDEGAHVTDAPWR
jgi:hypothetical protein